MAACAEKLKKLDEKFGKTEKQMSRTEDGPKDTEGKRVPLSPSKEQIKSHSDYWQYSSKGKKTKKKNSDGYVYFDICFLQKYNKHCSRADTLNRVVDLSL